MTKNIWDFKGTFYPEIVSCKLKIQGLMRGGWKPLVCSQFWWEVGVELKIWLWLWGENPDDAAAFANTWFAVVRPSNWWFSVTGNSENPPPRWMLLLPGNYFTPHIQNCCYKSITNWNLNKMGAYCCVFFYSLGEQNWGYS